MTFDRDRQAALCRLYIVDTEHSPYDEVLQTLPSDAGPVSFHSTANTALRRARESAEGIWFVSLYLPDLAGTQLLEMLAGFPGYKLTVAVGKTYSPEDESAARSSGACVYFVKPLPVELCRTAIERFISIAVQSEETPQDFIPALLRDSVGAAQIHANGRRK